MAPLRQTRKQVPHFTQEGSGRPFARVSGFMANIGQALSQAPHETQASVSTATLKGEIRSRRDCMAPKGQRAEHWVLFLVNRGITTTRARKIPMNAIIAR